MNDLEITEGNIIISQFIGPAKPWNDSRKGKIKLYCHADPLNPNCEAHELKYHNSWDKLMVAVEKIITCTFEDGDTAFMRTFGMFSKEGKAMVRFNRYGLFQADTLIEALWLAVIDFIKTLSISYYKNQVKYINIKVEDLQAGDNFKISTAQLLCYRVVLTTELIDHDHIEPVGRKILIMYDNCKQITIIKGTEIIKKIN